MRYLAIFLILIGFIGNSYGLVIPMTKQEVLDEFDLMVLGTVIDVKQLKDMTPVFTIEIEEIVKKPNSFGNPKTVSAIGCNPDTFSIGTPCPLYEVGQRGLFLLIHSKDNYEVSYYSQVAEPHCTSEQFLANYIGFGYDQGLSQDGQSKRFFTGKPVDIHYTIFNRDLKEKDYSVRLAVSVKSFGFSDVINGTMGNCTGHVTISASFIPTVMGPSWFSFNYDGGTTGGTGPSIIDYGSTPFAQYKAGIGGQDTWCKDDLILILKNDDTQVTIYDNHPACVTKATSEKLVQRGWGFLPEQTNALGYLGNQ
jgi:hypothetical protein